MSRREPTTLDMTLEEQEHVRNGLYFLRAKFGSWQPIAKILHYEEQTLIQCANGTRGIVASMAFRLARVVNIGIDDLVGGKFPEPGVCPRCAYRLPLSGIYRPSKKPTSIANANGAGTPPSIANGGAGTPPSIASGAGS